MVNIKTPMGAAVEDASGGDAADRLVAEYTETKNKPQTRAPDAQHAYDDEPDWLGLARDCYTASTQFSESSLKATWERNERAFQSKHPSGSKYYSDAYKGRSRLFRPKTRSMIRAAESQVATAFFGNSEVVHIAPNDDKNPTQVASAEINKELLQYRLTNTNPNAGIPWFRTVVGAYQDAQKYGVVCSKQYWEYTYYEEKVFKFAQSGGMFLVGRDGQYKLEETRRRVPIRNRPRCDLIPPENIRIDRGADWTDPINSSPFVILLHPMYIDDCEQMMKQTNPETGKPYWNQVDRAILLSAVGENAWDSTRQLREGNREDSKEAAIAHDEYKIVWIRENFMRWRGRDYVFWSVGDRELLTEPKLTKDVYLHCNEGERPIVMGCVLIETHKNYPSGKPELVQGLQSEANEVQNLRLDNVKLATSKRWVVKRGRKVDLKALVRGTAGNVILAQDPETDVKEIQTRDVTQSSYREQDRINADFDDIGGVFSTGSVQTNRSLNETVGGMKLMSGGANKIGDLDMRVFTETWAEPVLRQLMRLEQVYEDDHTILALAAQKSQLYPRFGVNKITDKLLAQDLTCRVNVGIGSTDPQTRLENFMVGAKAFAELAGDAAPIDYDWEEIAKEIFSPLGYRDGTRFIKKREGDPQVEMLQQQLMQLQRKLETRQIDAEAKLAIAQIGADVKHQIALIEQAGRQAEKRAELTTQMRSMTAEQAGAMMLERLRGENALSLEEERGENALTVEALRGRNAIQTAKARPQSGGQPNRS